MIARLAISSILLASVAHADVDTGAGTAVPPRAGLAIGAELGDPTSATIAWFADKLAIVGALGTGTREGLGISAHADVQLTVTRATPEMPVRIGLGARYYHHGYQPASVDERPDTHVGLRVPVSIALERPAMELYAELAPGIDVKKTGSCAFTMGTATICPHAQESPLFVQLVIGARWFLSH
jgi:hypothetical protein